MKINTDVDLEVEDCIEFLKNQNSHVQLVFLMQMASLYCNHPSEFKTQLQWIQYELCTEMSQDTRNMVRYMIDDLDDYLGSEAIKETTLPPSVLVGLRPGQTREEFTREVREAYEIVREKY